MTPFPITVLLIVMVLWIIHSFILNRRLIQSQSRYQQFFSDSLDALIVIDKYYHIIEWNQSAETIFGWSAKEALGQDIMDFIVPSFETAQVLKVLQKAATKGVSQSKNYNITKDRTEIFCEWRNRLLEETNGHILCIAQNITSSKKVLDDLSKRSSALDNAGDSILYTDHKGFIQYANQSFFFLNLSDPDDVYGSHIGSYLFKERLTFSALQSQFNTNRTWKGQITKLSKNGNKILSVTITAIYNDQRLLGYVANLHDITELSVHVDAMTHQAHHDPLTGATNRSAMNDRLRHAIDRAKRAEQKIALFFIDLNDFKMVNDTYGHETGDRLLLEVARNLHQYLRTSDTICRYGGDEFIIIIEEIQSQEHIKMVFQTIQKAINKPIIINTQITLQAKASIGMALYPDDATDAQMLIKAADMSMYSIKRKKAKSSY